MRVRTATVRLLHVKHTNARSLKGGSRISVMVESAILVRYHIMVGNPRSSALRSTLVLLAGVLFSVFADHAPAPVPATAPVSGFSSGRALLHLRLIAERPHPVGTAAHEAVRAYIEAAFRDLGLATQIQTATGLRSYAGGFVAAHVKNLTARLPGTANTKALLIACHYDSESGGNRPWRLGRWSRGGSHAGGCAGASLRNAAQERCRLSGDRWRGTGFVWGPGVRGGARLDQRSRRGPEFRGSRNWRARDDVRNVSGEWMADPAICGGGTASIRHLAKLRNLSPDAE